MFRVEPPVLHRPQIPGDVPGRDRLGARPGNASRRAVADLRPRRV